MNSNQYVANRFSDGKTGSSRNLRSTGDKLYSYATVIAQRMPSGSVIGNRTRYSHSTSKHQSIAHIYYADILVDGVPRGTDDLMPYRWRNIG